MPYIGKSPSAGVRQRYQYTATAGQTTFSGTDLGNLTLTYTDNNFVDVFQNGVLLKGGGTDYTATSGTSVVLATGASVSDVIEIIVYDVFSVGNFYNRTDSDSRFVRHDSATAGTDNFIAGNNAGDAIASGGNYNTLVGNEAGTSLTTGDNNTAVGFEALATEDADGSSTAIGYRALKTQNAGAVAHNTAVGQDAGTALTTGGYNTTLGSFTLSTDTQGKYSTAVGYAALYTQNFTSDTASNNTAVGYNAGVNVTTGTENTIVGSAAGDAMTDADRNTVVGYNALTTNTKSDRNTAIGRSALENLNHTSVTSGLNVAIGHGAGSLLTTGEKNTIIGSYSGNQDSLDIRDQDNNIVISDGDGNARLYYRQSTVKNWNINVPANSNNALIINNNGGSDEYGLQIVTSQDMNNTSNHFINCIGASTARFKVLSNGNVLNTNNSYAAISDEKLKENIVDSGSQWDDIKALKVRKYSLKEDKLNAPNKLGVIAQELESSGMNGLVADTPDLDNDLKNLGTVTKTVNYSILYMKAVKALQEAMTRIEALETKNDALEARIKKLEDG